jgi:hypothetical protein
MIQLAVVGAAAAVIGAVLAVTARDSRLVILGLLMAMVAAPFASSSEPTALALTFRVLGAALAAYLLWASIRDRSIESEGSAVDPVSELMVAAAAFAVGWFVAPVKPVTGPVAAQAAGFALIALAIVPLAGRNVLRVGAGIFLLLLGVSMLLDAWIGAGSSLRQVVVTVLLVGTLGATSLLVSPVARAEERPDAAETDEASTAEDSIEPVEPANDGAVQWALETAETTDDATAVRPDSTAAAEPIEAAQDATPVRPTAPRRASTARTSKPRTLRAGRVAAPTESGENADLADGTAPAPDAPSAEPAPEPTRARRVHPREQRQPRAPRVPREPGGPDR